MAAESFTSAGQVRIPQWVRDHLGLRPGDRLEFRKTRDGRVIMEKSVAAQVNDNPPGTGAPVVGRLGTMVGFEDKKK